MASPTFTPDVSGVYVASLVVNDTKSYSANQSLTRITVSSANVAPVASAGTAQTITGATLVTLSGTGSSDANGDTLSYKWYLTTKPAASTTASGLVPTPDTPTACLSACPAACLWPLPPCRSGAFHSEVEDEILAALRATYSPEG